jgi:hypothetical protein
MFLGSHTTDDASKSSTGILLGTSDILFQNAPASSTPSRATRMAILANGDVGIGTATPSQKLEVVGGEIKAGRVNSSEEGGQISFGRASDNATAWYIDAFGSTSTPALRFVNTSVGLVIMTIDENVGIGTSNITGRLVVSANDSQYVLRSQNASASNQNQFYIQHSLGNVTIGNDRGTVTYGNPSDYRLKEDLKDYNGLNIINQLKTYNFKWKESGIEDFGVLAHELQEVLPNYVVREKDELNEDGSIKAQSVDYSKIVPILIKSIQELKSENDTLKSILQRNNIS